MAELIGFASLPADTFAEGPASGAALTNPTNGRPTPFSSQPVQGFSGVQFAPGYKGDIFWFLSDNGFGAKTNSADYLLRLYQVDPNFAGVESGDGSADIQTFIQLSDPNGLVPFELVRENTPERWLTGADFDVESFVFDANGDLWAGEEFGTFLLHFDATGKLLEAPIETPNYPLVQELNTLTGEDPIVIGHRGASGEQPEHTLESYRLAILRGADFIEPDLVSTSDGFLIARHEPNLINTTDVKDRPEFADRKTTKIVDGVAEEGFFASDFTLAEIKTLRAVMPQGFRTDAFDGVFQIPTLTEIIDMVKDVEAETGKKIGIYPETKHPTYHDNLGLSLEEKLLDTLVAEDFTDPDRVFIQSFEVSNLRELNDTLMPAQGLDIPLVQLLDAYDVALDGSLIYQDVNARPYDFTVNGDTRTYGDLQTPAGLAEIAQYADGIGPWKRMIVSVAGVDANGDGNADDVNGDGSVNDADKTTLAPSSLIEDAHDAGLIVHAYTFRNEAPYLASDYNGNPEAEFRQFIDLGVDGYFTDFPGTGDLVRDQITADRVRSPQNPDVLSKPEFATLTGNAPIVIGHRGASGSRPEHTLESYKKAIADGADFIEPDLVVTKDGILIARHEPMLAVVELNPDGTVKLDGNGQPIIDRTNTSTNVELHPEFASRLTVKTLDGVEVGGWFAEDFTLAEIKTLNAIERLPALRGTDFDGDGLKIPTLAEVIDLVQQVEEETGRKIGIYPETKHPTFFQAQGYNTSQLLVDTLVAEDFTDPSQVIIQSFEVGNLQTLNSTLMPDAGIDIPLVQLFGSSGQPYDFVVSSDARTYTDLSTPAGLAEIATYADGIGPNKQRIVPLSTVDADGNGQADDLNGDGTISDGDRITGSPTTLIADAHEAGLFVHIYTLRSEDFYLPDSYNGDPRAEYQQFIDLGVDGFFTDFPGIGKEVVVNEYLAGTGYANPNNNLNSPYLPDPNQPYYGDLVVANLNRSQGFEGMAFSPDRTTLYPLLEGTVVGDPVGSLRIYEFDVASGEYEGLVGYYRLESASNAIGDFTPINDREFLVIERDNNQAGEAAFKKIFKVNFSQLDSEGFVSKEEVVNLLAIEDPSDLNGDGNNTYTMPFQTIEDVVVLDSNTILVANDNNYPFSIGRPPAIDNNEIVVLNLDTPLALDASLGAAAMAIIKGTPNADLLRAGVEFTEGHVVLGLAGSDELDAGLGNGSNTLGGGEGNDLLFPSSDDLVLGDTGDDELDGGDEGGNNLLYGGSGNDAIYAGVNDRAFGGSDDDTIYAGIGDNTLTGGTGNDRFFLAIAQAPNSPNVITDFDGDTDQLVVELTGVNSNSDLTFTDNNGDTIVTLAATGGTLAVLKNTPVTSLNEENVVTDENAPIPTGSGTQSQSRITVTQVESLGVVSFPTATIFNNTQVGGLSGLAYDPNTGVYYAISDDRSSDARFYTLTLDLSDGSLDVGDVAFTDVTTLLDGEGNPFIADSLDPEGIALTENGSVYVASEGNANNIINPFINEFSLSGQQLRELPIDDKYLPTLKLETTADNNQVVPPTPSTATATANFTLTNAGLAYTIQLNGVDLVPPEERATEDGTIPDTGINDVTRLHLHLGAAGTNGSHVLDIFGFPSENDADAVFDYENNTITGFWDDSDTPEDSEHGEEAIFSEYIDELLAGDIYFQVHTTEFPMPGEIRGQLTGFTEETPSGIRNNLAFESLTITPDGRYLYSATENALNQDGPAATLEDTSLSRIVKYDLTTGEVVGEYVYEVEAIPKEPNPVDSFATNGLVELLAIDNNGTLLALERSFSTGVGNTVKLYEVLTQGALDVKGFEDLYREEPLDDDGEIIPPDRFSIDPPVQKRLLIDFEADLGITPDNLEGLAWGPKLPDGRQSLIVVSDNNFSEAQTTQFIALALDVQTIPAALPTVETPHTVDDEDGTTPLIGDSDDPAVWIDPVNSSESIVIATLKDGGLAVFNLNGTLRQKITPADVLGNGAEYGDIRYNNVDVIYGVDLGTETVDIAVTSDRENDTLAIFKIDPSSRQLVNITSDELSTGDFSIFGVDDGEATAYGLAGYKSPLTGKDYVFVTQAGGNQIAQLELKADNTGAITGSVVRTLTLPLEEGEDATDFDPADYQSEAIVVDQEFGTVYVGVEGKLGIVKFAAEPNGGDTISIVRPIDSPELKPDLEGLGLYYGADGKGYLIASSQGDSSYAVYTREGNNNYLGSFIVGDNPTLGIDQANETDGLDIVNLPLGSQFPLGALLVHDGANEPQNAVENDDELENNSTNFKFVPWEGVANAFDKPLTIDTESYNPRSPVNRLVPSVSVTDGAVVEGISNQVSVIVSLSAASNQTITVDYQTGEQTAKAGQDYSSVSDTITFAPGETSQTLTIPILDDDISEDFETFAVELKKASNIQLPDSVASAVIEEVSSSLNQSPDDFEILEATEQTWPNGCLGLPGLDEVCTQALVPGWQVKVTDKQQTWVYRTDDDGSSIRLETVIPYVPLSGVKIEDSQGIVTISDVVSADTDFTLPARVENLDLIGADNISGTGNDNPNQITGNAGDNNLNGLAGADILTGGKGDDQLLGGSEEDILSGKKGKDSLLGDEGKDTLKGNGGKDNLNGGLGKDLLTGGAGKDIFEFSSQDDLFDRITDFVSGLDKIALDSSGFEGLTRGSLNEAQFVLGSRAEDESDRLIYNPNTGALFFDPDGTGEMGKMKMVVLEDQPLVRAEDIMIL